MEKLGFLFCLQKSVFLAQRRRFRFSNGFFKEERKKGLGAFQEQRLGFPATQKTRNEFGGGREGVG
jgi:hypothetical protein